MNAFELRERLSQSTKAITHLLFYRPPKPDNHDLPYAWEFAYYTEEHKYWKHVNRILNAKWEMYTVDVIVPQTYVQKTDRYVYKR